ncbi:MAG: Beta-galactosidase C-terminal domain, partial [Tepidisphaeraceae bacterium]
TDGERDYVFVLNFGRQRSELSLGETPFTDAVTGQAVGRLLELPAYGSRVLMRKRAELV